METVINILILETEPSDTVAVLDELHRPDLKIGTLEIKRPADVLPKLEMNPPRGDPRLHPGAGPRVVRTAGTSARVQPDAPGHRHHRAMRAGPACGAHGMWRRRACAPAKPRRTRRRDPLHAGEPPALAIHAGDRGGPGIGSGGITLPRHAGHLRTSGGPLHLRRLLAHRRCLWRMGAFQRLSPPESKDDHHPRALSRVRERSGRFLRTRPPAAAATLKADHFPSPACLNTTMLNGGSVSAAENGWLCIRCGSA